MLIALSVDYKFLQIQVDSEDDSLTKEQKNELDSRFEYVIKNPNVGKLWNEVKYNLNKNI